MSETSIEWTDVTWNPVRGCSRVSEGCRNCYAERIAARFSKPGGQFFTFANRRAHGGPTAAFWTGKVALVPSKLDEPLRWRKPRRVFVNSMSDLFHEALPFKDVARVFEQMAYGFALVCRKGSCSCECEHDPENYSPDADAYTPRCRCWREVPEHTYQILTKRPARMLAFFAWLDQPHERFREGTNGQVHAPTLSFTRAEADWPLPNVWLGVSVEDQATADERIPLLLKAPAAVRFVSYEPALEAVDLHLSRDTLSTLSAYPPINWVIVGGESGPGARPFDIEWARSAVRQCREAGVACFVKQLGAAPWDSQAHPGRDCVEAGHCGAICPPVLKSAKGGDPAEWPEDLRVREFPT